MLLTVHDLSAETCQSASGEHRSDEDTMWPKRTQRSRQYLVQGAQEYDVLNIRFTFF